MSRAINNIVIGRNFDTELKLHYLLYAYMNYAYMNYAYKIDIIIILICQRLFVILSQTFDSLDEFFAMRLNGIIKKL